MRTFFPLSSFIRRLELCGGDLMIKQKQCHVRVHTHTHTHTHTSCFYIFSTDVSGTNKKQIGHSIIENQFSSFFSFRFFDGIALI